MNFFMVGRRRCLSFINVTFQRFHSSWKVRLLPSLNHIWMFVTQSVSLIWSDLPYTQNQNVHSPHQNNLSPSFNYVKLIIKFEMLHIYIVLSGEAKSLLCMYISIKTHLDVLYWFCRGSLPTKMHWTSTNQLAN